MCPRHEDCKQSANSWKKAACYAETFEGCAEKIADHLQHSGLHKMEQEDALKKEQGSENPPPPPPKEVEAMESATVVGIMWSQSWLPMRACELCGGATVHRYASHSDDIGFMCGRKKCRKRLKKQWEQEDVAERMAALPVVEEEGEKEMDE